MKNNAEVLKQNIEAWFYYFTSNGVLPNDAAAQAIQKVKDGELYQPETQRERYDSASNRK